MQPHADPKRLLQQDAWLRRLATSLVGNGADADDLVQEAWVAGLKGDRTSMSDRGWLAGVLRNLRRTAVRSVGRQRDRHAGWAQQAPVGAPAADVIASDLELRELVSRAVRELDEPLRETIYCRYITGLSVKDAAVECGVAPSTITGREARGLQALRVRLDDERDGDRAGWVSALLPLALPSTGKVAGVSAWTVGSAWTIGLAAVALVGALWGLRSTLAPSESQDPQDLAALQAPVGPPGVASTASSEMEPVELAALDEQVERAAGRVELQGPAVQALDVELTVRLEAHNGALRLPASEHVSLVLRDGTRVSPEERGLIDTYRFAVETAGPARLEINDPRFLKWVSGPLKESSNLSATLRGNAAVRFRVLQPSGASISRYGVTLDFVNPYFSPHIYQVHRGTTDLPGGRLADLVPESYVFTIRAGDLVGVVRADDLSAFEDRTLNVQLSQPAVVSGVVVVGVGAPAAGRRVRLLEPARFDDSASSEILSFEGYSTAAQTYRRAFEETVTDSAGRFELICDRPGRRFVYAGLIQGDSDESSQFDLALGDEVRGIKLALKPLISLTGRVVFPPGYSSSGWTVDLAQSEGARSRDEGMKRTPLDADGRFSYTGLEPGRGSLYLFEPRAPIGYISGRPSGGRYLGTFDAVPGETVQVELPFPGEPPVQVTFKLTIEGMGLEHVSARLVAVGDEGAKTRLSLENVSYVPQGEYRLVVNGKGWSAKPAGYVEIGGGMRQTVERRLRAEDRVPNPR